MAAPTFNKKKVSQKINLKEEFGIDLRGKDSLKQALGLAIINTMVERTESGQSMKFSSDGKGKPGDLKSPYSKEYVDSLEFKAHGKSKNKVNMKLTGDMLGLIDVIKINGNTIEIGWDDDTENAKAYNHSVGDTVPSRPFFGVSKAELKKIKKDFEPDIKEALDLKRREGKKAFNDFVLGLIAKGGGEVGDFDGQDES